MFLCFQAVVLPISCNSKSYRYTRKRWRVQRKASVSYAASSLVTWYDGKLEQTRQSPAHASESVVSPLNESEWDELNWCLECLSVQGVILSCLDLSQPDCWDRFRSTAPTLQCPSIGSRRCLCHFQTPEHVTSHVLGFSYSNVRYKDITSHDLNLYHQRRLMLLFFFVCFFECHKPDEERRCILLQEMMH